MTGPLLTLLNAPETGRLHGGRMVGQRDALHARRPACAGDARRLRGARPASPAELRGAGRRRRPAGGLSCGPRAAARASASRSGCRAGSRPRSRCWPARATAMSAARRCTATTRSTRSSALVDRMRAAALIAQPGYGADAERHDIFAELAGRDFLRCALRVGPADDGAVRRSAGTGGRQAGERRSEPGHVSAVHLRHDGRAERRSAQRQHAARHGAHDGARLAARAQRCSTR